MDAIVSDCPVWRTPGFLQIQEIIPLSYQNKVENAIAVCQNPTDTRAREYHRGWRGVKCFSAARSMAK
jgi:hypothetical protein